MSKITKPANAELKSAWETAEAAMLRYKASLDPSDKARAVEKLWEVAREEAKIIARKNIDSKLPAGKRRDLDELGDTAVSSVFASKNNHFTLLSEKFDAEKASLRTFMSLILRNKLTDYVRKEPIPGLIGPGGVSATTLGDEPQAETNTLRDFASTLAPTVDHGATAHAPEASTEDDHATLQLLAQLPQLLPGDELEVFACEMLEMTAEEGLATVNAKRAEAGLSQCTPDNYRELLEAAQASLASHFPEYGATQAQRETTNAQQLSATIKAHLTEKEAEVFLCCYRQKLTNDAGLLHLCQTHGEREGPDGKMYPYMSLSDYKRKLKSARETIATHLPSFPL